MDLLKQQGDVSLWAVPDGFMVTNLAANRKRVCLTFEEAYSVYCGAIAGEDLIAAPMLDYFPLF